MDQKIESNGALFTGILLIFVGIIILPVAVGLCFSYPHELWMAGPVLLICSGMILYGAIRSLRKSSKKLKTLDAQIKNIQLAANSVSPPSRESLNSDPVASGSQKSVPVIADADTVLVRWTISPEEWKRFFEWESGERKSSNIIVSICIAVFGSLLLRYTRDATWGVAMAFSGVIALAYGLLSYYFHMSSVGSRGNKNNTVIVTVSSILINNKLNSFHDEDRWMAGVKIVEDADPKIFEVSYEWETRRGVTNDQVRVPIPKGKLGEAVLLMEELKKRYLPVKSS